jgi:F-type H+-transporting ATPase subunit b
MGGSVTLLAFAGDAIQLVPDGTLLFHLAVVVVMVGTLNVTLLRPINRILEERERRTKGQSREAKEALDRVTEKLLEYEKRIREARVRGYRLLEEERSAASRHRESRMEVVKAELMDWLNEEKRALHAQQEQARTSLAREALTRALEIGGQILRRPIGR